MRQYSVGSYSTVTGMSSYTVFFSNKVALVTGGNSGIGYATAKELVAQGATVIITGRRKEAIETAAKEIGAIPFVANQASLTDTEDLFKGVQQKFGKVDILFINAGIVGSLGSIENMSEENFDNVMGINFKGAYFTGPTRTEVMSKTGMDEATVNNIMDHLTNTIPLKKIGTAEDVAKLVTYLSDEGASFITGSEFVIDGGMTL